MSTNTVKVKLHNMEIMLKYGYIVAASFRFTNNFQGEEEAYTAQLNYVTREDLQLQAVKMFISHFFNTFTYRSHLPLPTDNPTNIDVLLYLSSTNTDEQNDNSFKFNLELNMVGILVDRNVLEATLKFVERNETSNRMNICVKLPIAASDTLKTLNRKRYARMSYIAIELFTNIMEHAAQMQLPSDTQVIRLITNHIFQRTETEIAELEENGLMLQILKVVERLDNAFQTSSQNSHKTKIVQLSQKYLTRDLEDEYVQKGLEMEALQCKMITKTTNVNIRFHCGKQFYANVILTDFESMSLNLKAKIVGIDNSETEEIAKYLTSTCSEINDAFLKGKKDGRIVLAVKQHTDRMEELVLTAIKMILKRLLIAYRSHLQCATVKTTWVDVLVFPECSPTDGGHGSNNEGELKLNLRLFMSRITEENEICTATVNFITKKTSSPEDYNETDIHLKLPISTKEKGTTRQKVEVSAPCYGIASVGGMLFVISDKHIKKISLDKTVDFDLNSHSIFCDLPASEVYYLAVNREKLLFSADDSVFCYDINGVFQWIYKMKIPKQITTDEDGNVFVADAGTNVIVRYDGKSTENLLTNSNGLVLPTGVHYDKQEKCLLVCNFSNGRAFLFDRN
ncbi:hypothetical protein AM593_09803, partial [Mytilus galloprovincialis]